MLPVENLEIQQEEIEQTDENFVSCIRLLILPAINLVKNFSNGLNLRAWEKVKVNYQGNEKTSW